MDGKSRRTQILRGLAVTGLVALATLVSVTACAYGQRLWLAERILGALHPQAFRGTSAGLAPTLRLQDARVEFACAGDTAKVELLDVLGLAGGDSKHMALLCAVRNGHATTAAYLIAHVDLNAVRPRLSHESPHVAQTALQEAVQQRHPQLLRMLLLAGADPNVVTTFGTALNHAAYAQDAAAVRQLLQAGARRDVMAREPALFSWASASLGRGGWRESLALAEAAGLSLKARDRQGRSLLHWAAAAGELELIQLLVAQGLPRLEADANGALPFMHLVGHIELVRREESRELRAALLLLMEGVQHLDAPVRNPALPADAAEPGREAPLASNWRVFPYGWTAYSGAEAVPWLQAALAEAASGAAPSATR